MANIIPENLKYTKEHEWGKLEGDVLTIGVTHFAQEALGDIVFVELPEKGTLLVAEQSFGVIESIKSVSDLYSPVSGEVLASNDLLDETPDLLNSSCYENWLLKIKLTDPSEVNSMMSSLDYEKYCLEQ